MEQDRRVQRTREAIRQQFRAMICEMEAGKITVTEIAERAGINRKTFYLHYDSIEALYEETLDEIVEHYMQGMRKLRVPVDMDEQTRVFFKFYCSQPRYVEQLLCEPSYRPYCDRIHEKAIAENEKRYAPNALRPKEEQDLILAFLVSSCLGLYRQWVSGGKAISVERLCALSCKLISDGYKGLMRSEVWENASEL